MSRGNGVKRIQPLIYFLEIVLSQFDVSLTGMGKFEITYLLQGATTFELRISPKLQSHGAIEP